MQKSIIIIGCGPGGYATAEYAARAGLKVTIFEKGEAGGTCLNRGCIPTKVYCHAAGLALDNANASAWGLWQGSEARAVDFAKLHDHKEAVVAQLRQGVETLMAQPGIELVRGEARLKDSRTVTCNGTDYTADNIIIATGSHPVMPRVEGIDNARVVSSTGLLALTELPRRLVIIGAGVIGMEMASAFNAFGTEVTVVEFLKECLPMADSDLAKRLRKGLEKRGVKFYLQAAAKAVGDKNMTSADDTTPTVDGAARSSADGVTLTFTQKGKDITVEGDIVLAATGRGPNTDNLGLDELGIDHDRHGIKVDDGFETSLKGVYAIGDVNGRLQLAHAAEAQGRKVIDTITGRESRTDTTLVPWAVFTTPELAGTGPTEDAAKASLDGERPQVVKTFYRSNGKAVTMDATDGLVKVIASPDGRLLACHALGAHAADLVQEVSALSSVGATLDDLQSVIHIHPTLQELL